MRFLGSSFGMKNISLRIVVDWRYEIKSWAGAAERLPKWGLAPIKKSILSEILVKGTTHCDYVIRDDFDICFSLYIIQGINIILCSWV